MSAGTDYGPRCADYLGAAVAELDSLKSHPEFSEASARPALLGALVVALSLDRVAEQVAELNRWQESRDAQMATIAGGVMRSAVGVEKLNRLLIAATDCQRADQKEQAGELRSLLESLDIQIADIASNLDKIAKRAP